MQVVIAFTILYIVWGSTYFFIRLSLEHIPPYILGAIRFITAGVLMLLWCVIRKEKIFSWKYIRPAVVSGLLLLFIGNGGLIWSEQYVASSLAAILLAGGPIWFVLLDKSKWKENFSSKETIIGLLIGFAGVILLFGERLLHSFGTVAQAAGDGGTVKGVGGHWQVIALVVLLVGSISWAAGSLYSKYRAAGNPNSVNAGWQMLAAGIAFVPASWGSGELSHFHWQEVSASSWLAAFYLVTMGSLAGYSAFTWLLQVRSATQVSTHAYVNPVVAVLLGVFFADENMSSIQLLGLAIILVSVLLINLAKYRAGAAARALAGEADNGSVRATGSADNGLTRATTDNGSVKATTNNGSARATTDNGSARTTEGVGKSGVGAVLRARRAS
jgi:drug/metabolite transporter (DMT)-like permease